MDDRLDDMSNTGAVKKRGRRFAQSYGRPAKHTGKRMANKGTRRQKPAHKQWS